MLSGDFFFLGVYFQVGLFVASPRFAVSFPLQSLTLYVQMHEVPGSSHPAGGGYSSISNSCKVFFTYSTECVLPNK